MCAGASRMRKRVVLPLILWLVPFPLLRARDAIDNGGGQSVESPSASEIRRLIQAKGTKAALAELTVDDEKWERVLDRMARGKQEWLEIVIDLYRVSDGSAAEVGSRHRVSVGAGGGTKKGARGA